MRLRFPRDASPSISPVNVRHYERRTLGERVADGVAAGVGSWPFIITQTTLLAAWIVVNGLIIGNWVAGKPFDPFPFILLNLVLSFQAAYTGPVVMMSQNRQAAKDRDEAEHDYEVNRESLDRLQRLEESQRRVLELVEGLRGSNPPSGQPSSR
jgi:uncharacterized membrane protein